MIDTRATTEIPANVLSSPALLFLYYRVEQIFGIKAEGGDLVKLNEYLEKSCGASFVENPAAYEHLLDSREQAFEISKFLTVNETYFFREGAHFEVLVRLLPQLTMLNRPIQICSAATSIGCEAYSIAMLLDYHAKNRQDFDFAIDAFDVNSEAIETAKVARYTANTLRKDGERWKPILDLYLVPDNDGYVVTPNIHGKVQFFTHNIMRGLDRKYDIIFFRNAMIYFSSKSRLAVLNNLVDSLYSDGLLFLGISETSSVNRPALYNRNLSDTFYFQKAGTGFYHEEPVPKDPHEVKVETKPMHTIHRVKHVSSEQEMLPLDCGEIAALLQAEEGQPIARKALDGIVNGMPGVFSGSEWAASVVYFLNTHDLSSANVLLSHLEKHNTGPIVQFLQGEYFFLLENTEKSKQYFEEAAAKDKMFWPAHYRIASLAADGNRTRYEYKIKKAIKSIELSQSLKPDKEVKYECFMGGFSPDYFLRILEKKLT